MTNHSRTPYGLFARLYDRIMEPVGYEMWADYIEELCRLYDCQPKRVLDLACGTGNTSFPFARRGYDVVGVDRSAEMLEQAAAKAQGLGLAVGFRQADMREFALDPPADLAICLYDSINYLLDPADLTLVCRRVFGALRPGGLFIFDANTPHRLSRVEDEDETMVFDEDDYCLVWRNSYAPASRIWRADLTGFLRRGDTFERFREVHEERAYEPAELTAAAGTGGLEVLGMFSAFGFEAVMPSTARVYVVARRPANAGGAADAAAADGKGAGGS
ncbi:MAG: class I SAM-dependent methyltransferase [Bacillota bacterium]|nr:class I SAM-dependent methyltransferase [Bacillota bacterium]